jgi:hypothetical protein
MFADRKVSGHVQSNNPLGGCAAESNATVVRKAFSAAAIPQKEERIFFKERGFRGGIHQSLLRLDS